MAAHLGCFDRVLATDDRHNLSARRKAAALVALYGERGFDYAGNARADAAVWKVAHGAIVVNPLPGAARAARAAATVLETIDDRPPRARSLARALRPHQWAKNLLVALPLLTAHRLGDAAAVAHTAAAFVALCLVASAVYLVNDLLDLGTRPRPHNKRLRPLAACATKVRSRARRVHRGYWPPPQSSPGACCPTRAVAGLATYAVLTVAYSTYLKRKMLRRRLHAHRPVLPAPHRGGPWRPASRWRGGVAAGVLRRFLLLFARS